MSEEKESIDLSKLKVKHAEGASFDWHEPTIDIYDEKLKQQEYEKFLSLAIKEEKEDDE